MDLLISGFEPFGGETTNPSAMVLDLLPNKIGNINLHKIILPVAFNSSFDALKPHINGKNYVIMLGQAGGSDAIRLEQTAVNLIYCNIPDNDGALIKNKAIIPNGLGSYNSTLPLNNMLNAIGAKGIKAQISPSAGAYVCNYVFYNCMHYIATNNLVTKAGFIHLPFEKQQVIGKGKPFMLIDTMAQALYTSINMLNL